MFKHSATEYPVKSAENSPTIYKQQGLHRIPAAPPLKDNDDATDDGTATPQQIIPTAYINGHIFQQGALNSPHQQSQPDSRDKDSATAIRHITFTQHYSLLLPLTKNARIVPDDNRTKMPTKWKQQCKNDKIDNYNIVG